MKIKIRRPDGSEIELEGNMEEVKEGLLMAEDFGNVVSDVSAMSSSGKESNHKPRPRSVPSVSDDSVFGAIMRNVDSNGMVSIRNALRDSGLQPQGGMNYYRVHDVLKKRGYVLIRVGGKSKIVKTHDMLKMKSRATEPVKKPDVHTGKWPVKKPVASAKPKEVRTAISDLMSSNSSVRVSAVLKRLGYSKNTYSTVALKRIVGTAKRMGFKVYNRAGKHGHPPLVIEKISTSPMRTGSRGRLSDDEMFKLVMSKADQNGCVSIKQCLKESGYALGGGMRRRVKKIFRKRGYDIINNGRNGSSIVKHGESVDTKCKAKSDKPTYTVSLKTTLATQFTERIHNHFKDGFKVLYIGELVKDMGKVAGSHYYELAKTIAKKNGFDVQLMGNQLAIVPKKPVQSNIIETKKKPFVPGAGIYATIMERFDQFPDTFTVPEIWKYVSPIPRASPNTPEKQLVSSNISSVLRGLCERPVGHRHLKVIKTYRMQRGHLVNVYKKVGVEPVVIPLIDKETLLKIFHDDDYLGFERSTIMNYKAKDGSRINDLQAQVVMKWLCNNRDYVESITGKKLKIVGDKEGLQVIPDKG